jgi:hypothetical protein
MTVIDLTAGRLERLAKRQQETNATLSRVVEILEAHSSHFERIEDALIGISEGVESFGAHLDALGARVDRLTTAIARGRTQDLERFADHERRIRTLEGKRRRPARKRPRG